MTTGDAPSAAAAGVRAVAPAPWTCRCEAIVWLARAPAAACAALPPGLADRRPLFVLGGLIRYHDTPVGSYDEIYAALAVRHGGRLAGHVPFMAVDSADSVAGGRGNWALPKVLADFAGPFAANATGPTTARGDRSDGPDGPDGAWSITVDARRAPGPVVPLVAAARNLQQWPDGRLTSARLHLRGRARPALITVESSGDPAVAGLLRSGRYPGAVVPEASFVLGAPHPSPAA